MSISQKGCRGMIHSLSTGCVIGCLRLIELFPPKSTFAATMVALVLPQC